MTNPKILFLDIETCPLEVLTWGIRDQYVAIDQVKKDWAALSWAVKWQGASELVYKDSRERRDKRNDKDLIKAIWKLLNKADIVVAHNGKAFDEKKLNARFVKYGLKPPKPYRSVDTLEIAKRKFAFTSNKLEYLAEFLGVGVKSKHKDFPGLELWKECMNNNPKAWEEMEKYNKQDVVVLEKVYDKLLAWDNTTTYCAFQPTNKDKCKCGASSFKRNGFRTTVAGKYQQYQCKNCGAWAQDGKNLYKQGERNLIKRLIK